MSLKISSYCPVCEQQADFSSKQSLSISGHVITYLMCNNCYSVSSISVSKQLEFDFDKFQDK
jgi:hypothetical protein